MKRFGMGNPSVQLQTVCLRIISNLGGCVKMGIHHTHKKHLKRHGLHDTVRGHDEMYNIIQAFWKNANVHHARMNYHRNNLGPLGLPRASMPRGGFATGLNIRPMFEDDQPAPQFDSVPRKKKNNPFGDGMPTQEQLRRM